MVLQLAISTFISVSVGMRYPLGQGLLMPFTSCHKLLLYVLRQLLLLLINDPFPGTSVADVVVVVEEVLI
jgi:hypothetical protein